MMWIEKLSSFMRYYFDFDIRLKWKWKRCEKEKYIYHTVLCMNCSNSRISKFLCDISILYCECTYLQVSFRSEPIIKWSKIILSQNFSEVVQLFMNSNKIKPFFLKSEIRIGILKNECLVWNTTETIFLSRELYLELSLQVLLHRMWNHLYEYKIYFSNVLNPNNFSQSSILAWMVDFPSKSTFKLHSKFFEYTNTLHRVMGWESKIIFSKTYAENSYTECLYNLIIINLPNE